MLEDAPEEMFGARNRWLIVSAPQQVAESATEEPGIYKEEIGIK
jgi:hypothetical protein